MAEGGYIKLFRQSIKSDIWTKPPLYWKIWNFILLRANYQDGETAGRGEFITDIEELRDAGTYFVGFRKVRPTARQIRRILDYLSGKSERSANGNTNGRMIDLMKVKNGMLIKVLKYDVFQSSEQHEGNNERSHERTTNGSRTVNPLSINKRNKEIKNKRIEEPEDDHVLTAEELKKLNEEIENSEWENLKQ